MLTTGKISTLLFGFISLMCIGCGIFRSNLSQNQQTMLSALNTILQEEKFVAGANGMQGYTGCKNEEERTAYSRNINECIERLQQQVKSELLQSEYLATIAEYEQRAELLQEIFRAETDESEMIFMYFERLRKLIEANPSI